TTVIKNNGNNNNYQSVNSEVIAILMDQINYPNGNPTANANHGKNPQKTPFLNAKMTSDTTSSGAGTDLVYRDPWGNPYLISVDLNGDNMTMDALYRLTLVSGGTGGPNQGLVGLVNPTGNADSFVGNTTVMVWSMGPDGQCSATAKANTDVNKD